MQSVKEKMRTNGVESQWGRSGNCGLFYDFPEMPPLPLCPKMPHYVA